MIRSQELIDKLVADLHFHNYLFVDVGDNIFTDHNEFISNVEDFLTSIGLDNKINAHTDFYHGGNVVSQRRIEHIYNYIDDVYIDYFFRTHKFHKIEIPKGFCYEQITPKGIIHPDENTEVILNLNDIYDRCTFVRMIYRLFGFRDSKLHELFPHNRFINGFSFNCVNFCQILQNEYPYGNELQLYIENQYKLNSRFNPTFRANEIVLFNQFCGECSTRLKYEGLTMKCVEEYSRKKIDYKHIRDRHIFGEYCIEDILIIYSLLINKFILSEENLSTYLGTIIDINRKKSFFNDFREFENKHTNYKEIEPFIQMKDLYLRFTSRKRSRAFKFKYQDELFESIQLFDQNPIRSLIYSNPIELPYLYNTLNLY